MPPGSFDGALPLRTEVRARPRSPRALHLLLPAPRVRRDPSALVELFRCTDVVVAVALLLTGFVLQPDTTVDAGLAPRLDGSLRPLEVVLLGGFVLWWYAAFVLLGMYGSRNVDRGGDELVSAGVASALGTSILLPLTAIESISIGFGAAVCYWLATAAAVVAVRRLLRALWHVSVPRPARRILIVGSGPRARDLLRQLNVEAAGGDHVVGHLDSTCDHGDLAVPYLGGLVDLETVLMRTAVDAVLIALPIKSCYAEVQRTIEICERAGVTAEYPVDVFRSELAEPWIDATGERTVVAIGLAHDDGRQRVKRALDILGATAGIILMSPLMMMIAMAIRLTSPGPVFFVQRRCGRNRRSFRMYKFRTMVCNAEALQPDIEHLNEAVGPVFKIRRDPRVTPIGRFLRRTSLDELPQLANVLLGDMSLVGPRPLPLRDVDRFSAAASMRRFSVRPGMTCLWQVNGRSDIHFDEWLTLDLLYIDRWSLLLDLRILLRTLPAVLRGEGAA
jgi:exopolysaccharide biosynthesis polyprenyl glycosylphosphotransferase